MNRSESAPSDQQFRALILQLGQGSDDAAWELVNNYSEPIRRAVRRVLSARLQSLFDSLDFVQLVWVSLFRYRDKFAEFQSPQELAAFLAKVAKNKVRDEARRQMVGNKDDLTPEQSLDRDFQNADLPDPSPQPVEIAIARESKDRLLRCQPAHYRTIIRLRLLGHTYEDIAHMVGVNESTVRRFLRKLERQSVK
jgi:RNA polymerase sigma factor (sigma-70 family)